MLHEEGEEFKKKMFTSNVDGWWGKGERGKGDRKNQLRWVCLSSFTQCSYLFIYFVSSESLNCKCALCECEICVRIWVCAAREKRHAQSEKMKNRRIREKKRREEKEREREKSKYCYGYMLNESKPCSIVYRIEPHTYKY